MLDLTFMLIFFMTRVSGLLIPGPEGLLAVCLGFCFSSPWGLGGGVQNCSLLQGLELGPISAPAQGVALSHMAPRALSEAPGVEIVGREWG